MASALLEVRKRLTYVRAAAGAARGLNERIATSVRARGFALEARPPMPPWVQGFAHGTHDLYYTGGVASCPSCEATATLPSARSFLFSACAGAPRDPNDLWRARKLRQGIAYRELGARWPDGVCSTVLRSAFHLRPAAAAAATTWNWA